MKITDYKGEVPRGHGTGRAKTDETLMLEAALEDSFATGKVKSFKPTADQDPKKLVAKVRAIANRLKLGTQAGVDEKGNVVFKATELKPLNVKTKAEVAQG